MKDVLKTLIGAALLVGVFLLNACSRGPSRSDIESRLRFDSAKYDGVRLALTSFISAPRHDGGFDIRFTAEATATEQLYYVRPINLLLVEKKLITPSEYSTVYMLRTYGKGGDQVLAQAIDERLAYTAFQTKGAKFEVTFTALAKPVEGQWAIDEVKIVHPNEFGRLQTEVGTAVAEDEIQIVQLADHVRKMIKPKKSPPRPEE